MRIFLPALAAAGALAAAPAAAQFARSQQPSIAQVSPHGVAGGGHRRHRDRLRGDIVAVTHSYGGEWALYNNRSSAPDSFNDWWHDRPDRAYPRWMQNNANCERIWWSGGGWRC